MVVTVIVGLLAVARGFPSYQDNIPNGRNVKFDGEAWDAVGHNSRDSGSELNPFGEAFAAAGYQWSTELCSSDSDSDGQSNGEELGDPDCIWTPGTTASRTSDIRHPGLAEGVDAPPKDRTGIGVIGVIAFLLVLSGVGALVGRLELPTDLARVLFWPRPNGWNLSNSLGIWSVRMALVGMTVGLAVSSLSLYGAMVALGLAAGIASPLPLLWAFMRSGAHAIFAMTREAAWRIHIAVGILALFFGLVHGAFAFVVAGRSAVTQQATGFFGLLLMIMGTIPALIRVFMPKCISYDQWKLLHFVSLVGYMLTLLHLLGHATKGTLAAILVCLLNFGAAVAYSVQLIYVKLNSTKIRVVDKVVTDQHVYLRMHAPGFSYIPGQWARVSIPSISKVAHPFTIVPDSADGDGHVQFFVKVSGEFTKELAETSMVNARVHLEGPYGNPPLTDSSTVQGVVFVVGGVGVTPALSLIMEASRRFPGKVRIYWNMRSIQLLKRCAPLLERHLAPEKQCIRLTGVSSDLKRTSSWPSLLRSRSNNGSTKADHLRGDVAGLPLGAQTGRAPLKPWLDAVAEDLSRQNVRSILLFVCGPAALVQSAQEAVAACDTKSPVEWRLHVERFEFLATSAGEGAKAKTKDVGGPIIENNMLGKAHVGHEELQSRTAFDSALQEDIPHEWTPHSLDERDADRIMVEDFDAVAQKTGSEFGLRQQQTRSSVWTQSGDLAETVEGFRQSCVGLDWKSSHGPILASGEGDLSKQQTLSSIWTRSGDLAETTEGYRQSGMGFDWKASDGPILAADPTVDVRQSIDAEEDTHNKNSGATGMGAWFAWRANNKQPQQTPITSVTSISKSGCLSRISSNTDVVEP
jgi:predicted ferric reductase